MIFKYFRHFQSFKSVPKKSAENHPPYMKVQNERKSEIILSPYDRTNRQGGGLTGNLGGFLEFYVIFFMFFREQFWVVLFNFFLIKIFFIDFSSGLGRPRRDLTRCFFVEKKDVFVEVKKVDKIAFLLEEKVKVSICNFLGGYAAFANIPDQRSVRSGRCNRLLVDRR